VEEVSIFSVAENRCGGGEWTLWIVKEKKDGLGRENAWASKKEGRLRGTKNPKGLSILGKKGHFTKEGKGNVDEIRIGKGGNGLGCSVQTSTEEKKVRP